MSSAHRYERIAALYDPLDLAEVLFKRQIRGRVFQGLKGIVLDAGAGTGRNIPYYSEGCHVVASDASGGMLRRAALRRAEARGSVSFAVQDIRGLGFADNSFDAIAATLLFGVLPAGDRPAALREMARVCRPGGEIRLVDYVPAADPTRRFLMTAFWAPYQNIVMKCSFDCWPDRDFEAAGLSFVREEYLYSDFVRMVTATPCGKKA